MGGGSRYCGRRSTKRARSARARATLSRSKTTACGTTSSSARGCSVFRCSNAGGWPVYETDPAKSLAAGRWLLARISTRRTRRSRASVPRRQRASAALRPERVKVSSKRTKRLRPNRDAAAKRIIERYHQEEHQADHEAEASDHQLLHDRLVKAEEIGKRNRYEGPRR